MELVKDKTDITLDEYLASQRAVQRLRRKLGERGFNFSKLRTSDEYFIDPMGYDSIKLTVPRGRLLEFEDHVDRQFYETWKQERQKAIDTKTVFHPCFIDYSPTLRHIAVALGLKHESPNPPVLDDSAPECPNCKMRHK